MRERADRLYRLDEPPADNADRPARADSAAATPQAAATDVRDVLRRRLADLPPWHPSSARADHPNERAERRDSDLPPDQEDDLPADSFWAQVSRCEAAWESHQERWPDKPDRPARAADKHDPPGSWRGRGDHVLSPEQNAQVEQSIADLRRPEPEITKLLKEIEQESPHGGVLVGLEHRLKGTDRLKEKILDKSQGELGLSLGDVISKINDAVRYTFCFVRENYVGGCNDIRQRLELAGYKMMPSRNRWLGDQQYKGINTCWRTPDGGRFELQFHIQESFYAKENLTHRSYDRLRAPDTSWEERVELKAYQRAVSGAIPKPPGIEQIPYRWEGSR